MAQTKIPKLLLRLLRVRRFEASRSSDSRQGKGRELRAVRRTYSRNALLYLVERIVRTWERLANYESSNDLDYPQSTRR